MACKDDGCLNPTNEKLRKVFIIVFGINAVMFGIEMTYGILANSTALIADSLDMLSDTFVYGISLYALNRDESLKNRAALIKGVLMFLLGLNVLRDVVIKLYNPVIPTGETIAIVGVIAFVANLICFYLLQKYKDGEINVRSAWICSRNDIVSNLSVAVAGLLVTRYNSMIPDIIVGLGIAVLVLQSSYQIIRESLQRKTLT